MVRVQRTHGSQDVGMAAMGLISAARGEVTGKSTEGEGNFMMQLLRKQPSPIVSRMNSVPALGGSRHDFIEGFHLSRKELQYPRTIS